MGLLDSLTYDPQMALGMGLLGASGNSRMPVSLGQALSSGWGNMQEVAKEKQKADLLHQQAAMQSMQLKKAQQEMADADAMRNFDFSKFYQSPQQKALNAFAASGQPGFNPPSPTNYQPQLDKKGMIAAMMQSKSPALMNNAMSMLTKETTPIKLGKDEQLLDPTSFKPLASNIIQDVKNGYLVSDGKGGWKIDPELYKAEVALKNAGATQVKMNPVYQVGNTFGETVAKEGAGRLFSQVESASNAPNTVTAANQVLGALETGKVMAGPGTKWAVAAKQIFGSDPEKLVATRQAIQGLAKISLQGRQSLKGQGSITDFEQRMLANAEAGNIDDMSVDEIKLIANGAIKNANYVYSQGKKASAALVAMPEFSRIRPAFDLPEMPSMSVSSPPPGAVRLKGQQP